MLVFSKCDGAGKELSKFVAISAGVEAVSEGCCCLCASTTDYRATGEIFPLPYLWASPRGGRSKSRRGQRRHMLKLRCMELGRRLIDTPNEWYGGQRMRHRRRRRRGRQRTRFSASIRDNPQVLRALHSLRTKVKRWCCAGSSGSDPTDVEYAESGYDFYGVSSLGRGASMGGHVQLSRANVAIPPVTGRKVVLLSLLPEDVVEDIRGGCVRKIGPAAAPPLGKVHSLLLGVEEGEYEPLVHLLVAHGLVELCDTAGAALQGIFGVPKGEMARLILNAKAANALCELAPDPKLPLIESLVKLVVPVGERLYFSVLDLSDYYHGLLLSEFLRDLFGLPPVLVNGVQRFPRWVTLPMGFSWAVYLAQLAHVHTLRTRSPMYSASVDLVGPARPRVLRGATTGAGTYIDDMLSVAVRLERSVELVQEVREVEVSEVREEKLQLAQEGVAVTAWGIELDEDGVLRPPRAKLRDLVACTLWCVEQGIMRTKLFQSLVGKWLWFAMLCRSLLSTFSPLFVKPDANVVLLSCGRPRAALYASWWRCRR